MHSKASALALAALVWPALMIAGINYSASKSNPGNIMISDGTNCTIIVVATNAVGSITGNSSTTSPCVVPNGEYYLPATGPTGAAIGALIALQVPQVVDGGSWQTTLVLTNSTATTGSATLTFYQEAAAGDGTTLAWSPPFLEVNSTQTLNVPAGGTLLLHTPGTAATLTEGWAQATVTDGVQIYAVFTLGGSGQGTAPATVAGNDILVPFNNANNNTTAIAMANPTANTEIVTFSIQNANGAISQSTLALPGLGHAAFLLGNQLPMTAGISGSLEFTTSGSVSIIALQSNPGNFFTTAQTYRVNGPVIGASDPLKCLQNPLQTGCSNPFLLLLPLTTNFMAGGTNYPILINITPGPNGTYNAAIGGSISGSPVNGYFTQGSVALTNGQPSFTFNITGGGSTFTTGSLTFSLTETAYDAVTGVATAFLSGSLNLNQPGAGTSSIGGTVHISYAPMGSASE